MFFKILAHEVTTKQYLKYWRPPLIQLPLLSALGVMSVTIEGKYFRRRGSFVRNEELQQNGDSSSRKKVFVFILASLPTTNTGRFIMYSGFTKIYDRKTVGHVFTKPVQMEGTTQFPPPLPPQKVVFHSSSHFCR
jgi:hypothetical protein